MKVSKEEVLKIRPISNNVLIKLEKENNIIKFGDGTQLELDTKYNPELHVPVVGTVLAVPDKLVFDKKRFETMPWLTDMELLPGDRVYLDFHAVLMGLGTKLFRTNPYPDPTYFELEGDVYILLKYEFVFFAVREGEIIMCNGFCIATPVMEEKKTDKIVLPGHIKRKASSKLATITHVGSPCRAFLDKKYRDVGELEPGDVVLFNRWSNQRVEYGLHQTMFEKGKEYVCIQRKWIKARITEKIVE